MSKPGRFSPGSDSESDWLEEDDVDVDQEAGPSRPRAASPTKKKARIAAPGDKVDSGMSAHTAHRLSQAYRQPKWRKLSNLVSHDVYEVSRLQGIGQAKADWAGMLPAHQRVDSQYLCQGGAPGREETGEVPGQSERVGDHRR